MSQTSSTIEMGLQAALASSGDGCPPRLRRAMRHAVFPGGARIRPRLGLAVAAACGDGEPALALAAATAVELLHCASLVHDDLPCFDDAPTRRGLPSVHRLYGEELAVLAGDALIVLAFDTIAAAPARPARSLAVLRAVARGVGAAGGIVAGQAWESEPATSLGMYHRAKTGALFEAAAVAGALASGADPAPWAVVGARLGEAYQVADDLADTGGSGESLGKLTGRDERLGRPNAVELLGEHRARSRRVRLLSEALAAIPACPGRTALRAWITEVAARLVPQPELAKVASL